MFMRIEPEYLKKLCNRKGYNLNILLKKSGVSKTAFYSLVRRDNILPKSIQKIAHVLQVRPSVFLQEENREERKIHNLEKKMQEILAEYPEADRENVWHTLLLLQEKPVDRLKRSLLRAQKFNFHR